MKTLIFLSFLLSCSFFGSIAQTGKEIPVYKDPEKTVEQRVNHLLELLTTQEKADLLTGRDMWHFKGIERLDIPPLQVTDCGHGVTIILDESGNAAGSATCFPTATAQAATWNKELIKKVGAALGRETRATGSAILLAPMVNIKRFPLNGRNYELFSEDPLLSGELASSFIEGVQSEQVGAVIKAMTANNQQANQSQLNVIMDEQTLREIYLPSFRIPVEKADPWGVMTAYNGLNGSHTSENKHLLSDILKEEWNYKGFVVSDWRGTRSTEALDAGLDLEMPGPGKFLTKDIVMNELEENRLTINQLNDKVRRILRAYVKTGLLDYEKPDFNAELNSEEHQLLARKVAEEAIVLLKNEQHVLPFKTTVKKLAVIGPNAAEARLGGGGSASVSPFYAVSPLEGLRNFCGPETEIIFEEGCGLSGNLKVIDRRYLQHKKDGKTAEGLKAEYFSNSGLKGEPAVATADEKIDFSWGWANPKPGVDRGRYSVKWSGQLLPPETGNYKIGVSAASGGFRLYIDEKLVFDEWTADNSENFEAELTAVNRIEDIELQKEKPVDIRLEFYKRANRNFIRLEWEIPGNNSIELARQAAARSDAVIIFAGLSNFFEGGNNDREDIILPGEQDRLIREVAKVNSNTAVILINGTPVAMPWLDDVNAVMEAYYPGQEGGNAIARVLFGEVNPSGKLPETFPVKLSDNPAWGNYPGENNEVHYDEGIFVGYRHYDANNVEPLFPFGHGLSYTSFEYNDLKITKSGDSFLAEMAIQNTGNVAGAEVVQLYLSDVKAGEPRPVKELKEFRKVTLSPNEKQKITFEITRNDLSFFAQKQNKWIAEPGEFEVLIGSSSRDIRLSGVFTFE